MLKLGLTRCVRAPQISAILRPRALPVRGILSQTGPSFIRFNSSSPAETAAKSASEIKHELVSFADPANANPVTDMTSDQLGYLDSIGMASGFGPTAIVERILEYTHVYTGLPWWSTIIVATVALRLALFPLYVRSSSNAAKMTRAKPELDQLSKDLANSPSPQEQATLMRKRKAIMSKYDVNMLHSFGAFAQLPFAYGFFQALRKMANHPVEGFSTQGYGWFKDLTQVDPYCGLQGIAAAVVVVMVRSGGETGANEISPFVKKLLTFLPVATILLTKDLSSAVCVYFAANATISSIQGLLFRNKSFRKLMKMPDIVKPPVVPGAPKPPTNFSEWWKQYREQMESKSRNTLSQSNEKMKVMNQRKASAKTQFIKKH